MFMRCGSGMMEGGTSVPKQGFALNKLVEVEWRDACGIGGWREVSVCAKLTPEPCKTAGYLLKRTKKEIIIALSQSEQHDINQCISIPTAWVTRVRRLKY